MKNETKTPAYEIVTKKIIELIEEKKVLPWQIPWKISAIDRGTCNYKTKHLYRGVNAFLTQLAVYVYGYSTPYFLTFNQASDLGGSVKKGAKGLPILFWHFLKKQEKNDAGGVEEVTTPIARYYTVFNLDQIDNIQVPENKEEMFFHDPIKACEKVLKEAPAPKIEYLGSRACYSPLTDVITLPVKGKFPKVENFYSTLFHELTHSTGHKSRLNRSSVAEAQTFGTLNYGKEELIAEMGAAFLCGYCGIENETITTNAAYLKEWLSIIKKTPKILIEASSAAQKATDLLLKHEDHDHE